MEEKTMQVMKGVKPNVVNWIGALIGAALAWWTGLPPLAQALLIVQGADILTGLLCAVTGKSRKTESGKVSSGALLMGVIRLPLHGSRIWNGRFRSDGICSRFTGGSFAGALPRRSSWACFLMDIWSARFTAWPACLT